MKPSATTLLKFVPFFASVALFLTASLPANFRVETVQPNGLPDIEYPFAGYSYTMYAIAIALLLFTVSFNFEAALRPFRQLRIPALKASLLALGATLALFSGFSIWLLYADYSTRCFGGPGCESVLGMYVVPAMVQTVGVALGLVLSVLGIRFGGVRNRTAEKAGKGLSSQGT